MSIKRFLTSFLRDDRGQSTTEYILILSVVVMIAMKFRGQIQGRLDSIMGKTFGKMDEAVSGE